MHVYAMPDWKQDQDTNDGLRYIGRIYLEDHMECRGLFEIAQTHNCDIHPFEDVRLRYLQVECLASIFRESGGMASIGSRDSYRRIMDILEVALQEKAGILNFSD